MLRVDIPTHSPAPARRARPASVLTAALAIAVGLLAPGSAAASPGPAAAAASAAAHTRSTAHPSSARQSCAAKRHGESSGHGRSSAKCTKKRPTKQGHQPAHHPPASSPAGTGTSAGGGSTAEAAENELPSPEVTGATTGAEQGEAPGETSGEPSGAGAGGSDGAEGGPSAKQGSGSTEPGGDSAEQSEGENSGGTVADPIDPKYLTETPFGTTSFWIQPWRAYLDTWPASRLLESLGINFNVSAPQAEATAQLLQDSGFKLARIAINWDALSYGDPTQFSDETSVRTRLEALHKHGLRPLILLDANSEGPTPATPAQPGNDRRSAGGRPDRDAHAGQRRGGRAGQDRLRRALLRRRPRHPDRLGSRRHRHALQTAAGRAAVRRAQRRDAAVRAVRPPTLAGGEPNPAFQETLAGWLSYVATVCKEAASIFGPDGYDLEVWNELSFGSQFLNAELLRRPPQPGQPKPKSSAADQGNHQSAARRNGRLRAQPANGIGAGVGISDGFASQTPFPSGAQCAHWG